MNSEDCEVCYWNDLIESFQMELREGEEEMEYSQIHDINLSMEAASLEIKTLFVKGVKHTCGRESGLW